jgi:hypothetical protein
MLLIFVYVLNGIIAQNVCSTFRSEDSCIDNSGCDWIKNECKQEVNFSYDCNEGGDDDCIYESNNCESLGTLQCSYQPAFCYYENNQCKKREKTSGACNSITVTEMCLRKFRCDYYPKRTPICDSINLNYLDCLSLGKLSCSATQTCTWADNGCVNMHDCASFRFQRNRCLNKSSYCDYWWTKGCGYKVVYSEGNCQELGEFACNSNVACIFDSFSDDKKCYLNDCSQRTEDQCAGFCDYFSGGCGGRKTYSGSCSVLGKEECENTSTPCRRDGNACVDTPCGDILDAGACRLASSCDWFGNRCDNYKQLDESIGDCSLVGEKECVDSGIIIFLIFFFFFFFLLFFSRYIYYVSFWFLRKLLCAWYFACV